MNDFLERQAAAAPSPGGGDGFSEYIALTGASAYDETETPQTVIDDDAIAPAGTHHYVRWTTVEGSSDLDYDATHAGGGGTTAGANGVVAITTAGVYEISLSVGVTIETGASLSTMAFARVDVLESDGTTTVATPEFSEFLRTSGTGRGEIAGTYGVDVPAGACVKVYLRHGTTVAVGFELVSASSSLVIKRLA